MISLAGAYPAVEAEVEMFPHQQLPMRRTTLQVDFFRLAKTLHGKMLCFMQNATWKVRHTPRATASTVLQIRNSDSILCCCFDLSSTQVPRDVALLKTDPRLDLLLLLMLMDHHSTK
jgi:hypothetical protein